jgi:hypothetical protein
MGICQNPGTFAIYHEGVFEVSNFGRSPQLFGKVQIGHITIVYQLTNIFSKNQALVISVILLCIISIAKTTPVAILLRDNIDAIAFTNAIATSKNSSLATLDSNDIRLAINYLERHLNGHDLLSLSPIRRVQRECESTKNHVVGCIKLAELHALAGQLAHAIAILESQYHQYPDNAQIETALLNAYGLANDSKRLQMLWQMMKLTKIEMEDFFATISTIPGSLSTSDKMTDPSLELPASRLFVILMREQLSQDKNVTETIQLVQQIVPNFEVFSLNTDLTVRGGAMRWLTEIPGSSITYGTPLAYSSGYESPFGIFGWSGEAVAFLSVEQAGDFMIQLRLRHSSPPPVDMALGVNRKDIYPIILERGDDSTQMVEIPIRLNQGIQTIHLWFLNNGIVNGKDRDALLEFFSITKNSLGQGK